MVELNFSTESVAHKSKRRLLKGAVGPVLLVAMGLILVSAADLGEIEPHLFWIGWAVLLLGGAGLARLVKDALTLPQEVIRVAPSGIKDIRVSRTEIPWSGIKSLSVRRVSFGPFGSFLKLQSKLLMIDVDPNLATTLKLSRWERFNYQTIKGLGATGLAINDLDTSWTQDQLIHIVTGYARAHNSNIEITN